jgi:hypothetical protein
MSDRSGVRMLQVTGSGVSGYRREMNAGLSELVLRILTRIHKPHALCGCYLRFVRPSARGSPATRCRTAGRPARPAARRGARGDDVSAQPRGVEPRLVFAQRLPRRHRPIATALEHHDPARVVADRAGLELEDVAVLAASQSSGRARRSCCRWPISSAAYPRGLTPCSRSQWTTWWIQIGSDLWAMNRCPVSGRINCETSQPQFAW